MERSARRCFGFLPSIRTAAMVAALSALLGACAQAPTGSAQAGAAGSVKTPWATSTSTYQWNDYATDLIARNAIGQFPAQRTLAYLNLAINNAIVQASAQGLEPDGAAACPSRRTARSSRRWPRRPGWR